MTVSVNMYEVAKQHIFSFDNCDGSHDTCTQSLFVCFRELRVSIRQGCTGYILMYTLSANFLTHHNASEYSVHQTNDLITRTLRQSTEIFISHAHLFVYRLGHARSF